MQLPSRKTRVFWRTFGRGMIKSFFRVISQLYKSKRLLIICCSRIWFLPTQVHIFIWNFLRRNTFILFNEFYIIPKANQGLTHFIIELHGHVRKWIIRCVSYKASTNRNFFAQQFQTAIALAKSTNFYHNIQAHTS